MYDLFRDVLSSLGFFQTLKMAPGFRFFTVFFFHGLEGPGFRIFTGVSKGQGSDFSLVFSGFSLVVQLFHRRGGSRVQAFHCFFFSRARGARVQVFHWRRGPRVLFFTGSRGQGSGFSLASGP